MSHRRRPPTAFDRDLAELPEALRWREWIGRVEAAIFASPTPVPRETLAQLVGSALLTLNRNGSISNPPPDLVALLSTSLGYHELTEGALDPTVQPVWAPYARHFSSENPDPEGPKEERLKDALSRVGW